MRRSPSALGDDADQGPRARTCLAGPMRFLTFFTATCFLLALPGQTNTLLTTSRRGPASRARCICSQPSCAAIFWRSRCCGWCSVRS